VSYLVLARKYRPKQFSDIVGQQSVVRTLVNAIKLKRTHQAYVFSGSRGIGKTSIARIFSKALRCPNVVEKDGLLFSCDHCSDCKEIAAGTSVNVLEVDGASNNGVDSVREIRENAKFLPTSGLYKIYIIDEVHMLSTAAFNALLKTLEEPPEHVVFIFATTESHKIPETILGRCQRFDFKRVTVHQISERVMEVLRAEKIDFEPAAINLIARAAEGSMRDALSISDQVISFSGLKVTAAAVKESIGLIGGELVFALLQNVLKRDAKAALQIAETAFNQGVDLRSLLKSLIEMLHALILVQVGIEDPVTQFSSDELMQIKTLKPIRPLEDTELVFQVYHHGLDLLSKAAQPKLILDLLLIKTALAETLIKLEDGKEKVVESPASAPRRAARPSEPEITQATASENARQAVHSESVKSVSAPEKVVEGSARAVPAPSVSWETFVGMSFEKLPMLSVILESAVEWTLPQGPSEKVRLGFREKDKMKVDQLLSKNFREPFVAFTESFFGFKALPDPYITESKAESMAEKNDRVRLATQEKRLRMIHDNAVVQEAKSLFGADLTQIEFTEKDG